MLNHLNKEIITAYTSIQADEDNNQACASLGQEIAYMVAGGKRRIYLNELASSQTGWLINKLTSNVVDEQEITVYPENAPSAKQSLNATLYTVASYAVLMNGYTSQKLLATALEHWFEQDQPDFEAMDWEALALDIVTIFIRDGILSGDEDQGRMNDGAWFSAFPATEEVLKHRIDSLETMWSKATPKMKPMLHKVTWQSNGTCEIPNLRLTCKGGAEYIAAFNRMNHTGFKINAAIRAEVLKELELCEMDEEKERTLDALAELNPETTYYFPHTDDYRGRAYARGGLTTPQGIKELRACFDFARYTKVNEYGLFLHIANAYGQDKISIDERLQWVRNNHLYFMTTPQKNLYAERARLAYIEYKTTGESNVICRIDGTCSGVQLTSGLYLDAKTAKAVNVGASLPSDTPQDIYGIIADRAILLANGKEKKTFQDYHRNITKKVIMILAYGAGEQTRQKAVKEFLDEKGEKGNVKKLEKLIMKAITLEAPAITKLNKNLQRLLKAKPTHKVTYKLSDVELKFSNFETEHLNVRGSVYSAKLVGSRNKDTDALARGSAPNFVHSLDSELLRKAVNIIDSDVSCIHDDIGCQSGEVIRALQAVRVAFVEVIERDPLADLYKALGGEYIKQDNGLKLRDVLESTYLFS